MANLTHLKEKISIIDLADKLGIEYKISGSSAWAICVNPSHEENKPSMKFYLESNSFNCFGCEANGSTIDLVLNVRHNGQNNKETIKQSISWLCSEYGMNGLDTPLRDTKSPLEGTNNQTPSKHTQPTRISRQGRPRKHQQDSKRNSTETTKDGRQYSDIYRYFLDLLYTEDAIKYLVYRGITNKSIISNLEIKSFPDHKYITNKLREKFDIELLLKSGLLGKSKSGENYYLTFWKHRLIFPYFDKDNKTILGIEGKNIDDTDSQYKALWLNSIDRCLYNPFAFKQAKKNNNKISICEGVIDVLSIYQMGWYSDIGFPVTMGGINNWKDNYFDLISEFDITLAVDNDSPGRKFIESFSKKCRTRFLRQPNIIKWSEFPGCNDINEILVKG